MFYRKILVIVVNLLICFGVAAYADNSIIVDVAKKTAQSNTMAITVKAQFLGQQSGLNIKNTVNDSIDTKIVYSGLTDKEYDVYVSGSYVGVKTADSLSKGLVVNIPGALPAQPQLLCLKEVKPKLDEAIKKLKGSTNTEEIRVLNTLQQASSWAVSGISLEENYRSASVIVAPAGIALKKMYFPTRSNAEDTQNALLRSCWLLQNARDRMYKNIKDPSIRNFAVDSLTPVTLNVNARTEGKSIIVNVELINNCDLSISGEVLLKLPAQCKTTSKPIRFSKLESGKKVSNTFTVKCNDPSLDISKIKVSAGIKIVQDVFEAKLSLVSDVKIPEQPK